jgi:uncharacterized protein YebE (UPF0316 family)
MARMSGASRVHQPPSLSSQQAPLALLIFHGQIKLDTEVFVMNEMNWILPLLVFFARIVDVTLGTLRIIYIGKGKRLLAPLLGFVEVFIWIVMVSQLVKNVSNLVGYLAYAAGFAAGNYIGMVIENRLAIGTLIVRAIVAGETESLVQSLKEAGYGVTVSDAQGISGPVTVIYTVINRKELKDVIRRLQDSHPRVFYTVEEARLASEGVFHRSPAHNPLQYLGLRGKG